MVHRFSALLLSGAFMLTLLIAGTQAKADVVHFRYIGGRWSHSRHPGWHRYWGGPSIGYYWAPAPVYIVRGYEAPRYYTGSDFWYSNPSFGLRVNGGNSHRRIWHRDRDRDYRGRRWDEEYRYHRR